MKILKSFASSVIYPPGGEYGPRIQRDLQLVHIHRGYADIYVDSTHHHVPEGHIALLKPGRLEKFSFAKDSETWHRWIAVTTEPLSENEQTYYDNLPFYLPISKHMNQITDMMIEYIRSGTPTNDSFICLLGKTAVQLYEKECQTRAVYEQIHPAVLQSKSIMRDDLQTSWTLQHLANKVGVSPEHLIRLYRRYDGMTPMQYLWSIRTKRGQELLRNSGLLVGEIAEQVGFKSAFHFSRLIKQATGMTPTAYRKKEKSI